MRLKGPLAAIMAWMIPLGTLTLLRSAHAQGARDVREIDATLPTDGAVSTANTARPHDTVASSVPDPRYATLPELTWRTINTREVVRARLYRPDGTVDPAVVRQLAHMLRDVVTGEDAPVVTRTLQLIVKIATHFDAREIEIVSGYRTGRNALGRRIRHEGYHSVGSAVDFRIVGVETALVAAYARTFAHVGVGLYPRLDFVHLDSRETTFFWENRAGRGRRGYDRPLVRQGAAERDRTWQAEDDAPWDPPGVTLTLDTHPRTAPGAHRSHRRSRHRRDRQSHSRHRPRRELHVFTGADSR
jgi:uncharacterized protein YcbK (DUF882 family)